MTPAPVADGPLSHGEVGRSDPCHRKGHAKSTSHMPNGELTRAPGSAPAPTGPKAQEPLPVATSRAAAARAFATKSAANIAPRAQPVT